MSERSDSKRLDVLGSTIDGRWRLSRMVGHGGMATVYEAIDLSGRRVALKLLHSRYSSNELVVRRFLREARLANAIEHPRVVRVEHVGLHGHIPYLVMPFLSGESLDSLLRSKGALEVSLALSLIDQALDVMIAAHAGGILHRDIKPANLHLDLSGQLRVLDFGVGSLPENMHTTVRTSAGSLLGTPGFMSPEQARADWPNVTVQSDIWSLGATLFTLLSNRLVHEGRTPNEVLGLAMTRPAPSLGQVLSSSSPHVVGLVDKALRYEPSARFSSAREMQLALRLIMNNPSALAMRMVKEKHRSSLNSTVRGPDSGVVSIKVTPKRSRVIAYGALGLAVMAGVSTVWARNTATRRNALATLNTATDTAASQPPKEVTKSRDALALTAVAKVAASGPSVAVPSTAVATDAAPPQGVTSVTSPTVGAKVPRVVDKPKAVATVGQSGKVPTENHESADDAAVGPRPLIRLLPR